MPATVQESTFNSGFAMAESIVGQMINGAPAFIAKGNFLSIFALSYATSYSEISANNVNHYTAGQIQAAAITSATLDASASGLLVLGVTSGVALLGFAPAAVIGVSALTAGVAAGITSSSANYDAIKQSITNSIINGAQNFDALLNSYNNVSAASLESYAPINSSVTVTSIGSTELISVSQTNSSGVVIATASDTLGQNSVTVDIKSYLGSGVQNEQVINDSSAGVITDAVSGSGVAANLSNATITLANGASATITGDGNTDNIGANANLTVNGNNNQVNLNGNSSTANITGNTDSVRVNANSDTVNTNGINDFTASFGDGLNLTAAGAYTVNNNSNVIDGNNDVVDITASNAGVIQWGNHSTITLAGVGDGILDQAGGNVITLAGNAGNAFLNGNASTVVSTGNNTNIFAGQIQAARSAIYL